MSEPKPVSSRRDFLKTGSAAVATGVAAANLAAVAPSAYAAGTDQIKVGLVGCGGRGSGAAANALQADPHADLVAVADAFEDNAKTSLGRLRTQTKIAGQIKVPDDAIYSGLDAYKRVIDDVDVVMLATPPGFRPVHLRAAVDAGKHVFTEKPMATDAPGLRSVLESVEIAKQKNLALLAGFCWRYDYQKRALFERVLDGQIGQVRAVYGTYLTAPVKPMPPANKRPAGMSDLEWQIRNWYNFTWLSGDGLVEQACHTVDWVAWAFGDKHPESATAVGGRQIPAEGGNIYDHIEVNFLFENDARGFLAQRQNSGCYNQNSLYILGTKGTGKLAPKSMITDLDGKTVWEYDGDRNNMYDTEHNEFFASIRSGKHINDGDRMANSTLMALMGRMAGYTGKEITWDMALNSQLTRVPEITNGFDTPHKPQPLARPGVLTKYK